MRTRHIVAIICFTLAALILTIPLVGSWVTNTQAKQTSQHIRQSITKDPQCDQILKSWQTYNQQLLNQPAQLDADPFDDEHTPASSQYQALEHTKTPLATVTYPRLNIDIPVYWGTGEDSLNKGAGHLAGTSLPLGQPHEHTVLSAHRADPTKPLFTRLGEAKQGDTIQVTTINGTHTYQVTNISVVDPDDTTWFHINATSNITLLTCTPYAVNTHRLLVTAKLVASNPKPTVAHVNAPPDMFPTVTFLAVIAGCALAIVIVIRRAKTSGKPRKRHKA